MDYVCTACGRIINYHRLACPYCDLKSMKEFHEILEPNIRLTVKSRDFKYIPELTYEELIYISKDSVTMTHIQVNHSIAYHLMLRECEFVSQLKEKELPLYINTKWVTIEGRKAYRHRLTGEGELIIPGKNYYAEMYLDRIKLGEI